VIQKSGSLFHKVVGVLFGLIGNKAYMHQFWTTINYTTAAPKCYDDGYDAESWKTVLHEGWHAIQRKKYGIWFPIGYLFPQVLGIVGIICNVALLSVGWWTPWVLIPLAFLLPLPAPFRALWEWEAYKISIACDFWHWGDIKEKALPKYVSGWLVANFTGPSYYFMWPFRGMIERESYLFIERLKRANVPIDLYLNECRTLCVSHRKKS